MAGNKTSIRVDSLANKICICHSITRIGLILNGIDMKNKSDPINVVGVNPLETVSDKDFFHVISHVPVIDWVEAGAA
jgi:hypothetical protein